VTLNKRGHNWKKGVGRTWRKGVTLGKKCPTFKNESHFGKWATLEKLGHTWKKWLTLEKMGHTWKNGSHLVSTSLPGSLIFPPCESERG